MTERDLEALEALAVHRFARTDHIHALVFPKVTLRVVQRRLRLLWDHGYVERAFLPLIVRRNRPLPPRATQPIYMVTPLGRRFLVEHGRNPLPQGVQPRGGLRTLEHHLVVTDFCVALRIALRSRPDLHLTKLEHEHLLWPRLAQAPSNVKRAGIIVPDAAFTLSSASGRTATFYLEVVRAGVKGGNRGLLDKLNLYAKLKHRGFFHEVYDHKHLRAVIFATTSEVRAGGFLAFAETARHARRLFWFGSYLPKGGGSETVFRPSTVLTQGWRATQDQVHSLLSVMTDSET